MPPTPTLDDKGIRSARALSQLYMGDPCIYDSITHTVRRLRMASLKCRAGEEPVIVLVDAAEDADTTFYTTLEPAPIPD